MFIQRPSELLIAPIQSPDYRCIWFFPSDIGFASALSSWWSYCDDRPLVKQWPIVAVFCLRMISTMGWLLSSCSHPSRHRAHGQELDVGVRVLGTGPEAVHGRLRRHPLHEQCQTFPLPGIVSPGSSSYPCSTLRRGRNILYLKSRHHSQELNWQIWFSNLQNNANRPSSAQTWTIKSCLTLHCDDRLEKKELALWKPLCISWPCTTCNLISAGLGSFLQATVRKRWTQAQQSLPKCLLSQPNLELVDLMWAQKWTKVGKYRSRMFPNVAYLGAGLINVINQEGCTEHCTRLLQPHGAMPCVLKKHISSVIYYHTSSTWFT